MEEILKKINTIQEVRALNRDIQILLDSQYEPGVPLPSVSSLLAQPFQAAPDKVGWLNELRKQLSGVVEVSLTLAIEPSEALIDRIGTWLKALLGPAVVFSWKQNRQILGGALIEFRGKYGDYTVGKKLKAALYL